MTLSPSHPPRPRSFYESSDNFTIPAEARRSYEQQYADIYFARLTTLKPEAALAAVEAWSKLEVAGQVARQVDRVLDVKQGILCWIIGTVFMDYSRKPNVLDDIVKEHWIVAPEEREKFFTTPFELDHHGKEDGNVDQNGLTATTDPIDDSSQVTSVDSPDKIMLEDESGRIQLIGPKGLLRESMLVTGAIIAVLGTETESGAFEIVDVRTAGLAPQVPRHLPDPSSSTGPTTGSKIAIVSGLGITTTSPSLRLDLLSEFLTGELLPPPSSPSFTKSGSEISRLIIAGNALGHSSPILTREEYATRRRRQHEPDRETVRARAAAKAAEEAVAPTRRLDAFLSTILPSVPVTLLPGSSDPTGAALPQTPIHQLLLPRSRAYARPKRKNAALSKDGGREAEGQQANEPDWLDCVTNPWEGKVDGWTVGGNSGQPIDDFARYISHDADSRALMAQRTLEWRVVAPSAPDTIPCYPFHTQDPFVVKLCPHIYFIGNQPRFETSLVTGQDGQTVRIVCVPSYEKTGMVVLVDSETREVEVVELGVDDGDVDACDKGVKGVEDPKV